MEFFKPGTRYSFLSVAKPLLIMSAILVTVSWGLVATKGLNFGIDFAGGTEALLSFKQPTDIAQLRETITETGLELPEVVTYGHSDQGKYFVRSRSQSLFNDAEKQKLRKTLVSQVGALVEKDYNDTDETGEEVRVRFAKKPGEAAVKAALVQAGYPNAQVGVMLTLQTLSIDWACPASKTES
jgi:preprotein translocase subunit SecF